MHVDMDAFYASVEQRDNPSLRGKPLIVGGTGNRGVVAAASYEVRAFGVHSAMPVRDALRRCPDAICVRPRMDRYREVSRQVFAVFRSVTPVVEGLSLDEAFLDITASQGLFGGAAATGRKVKADILAATGLTASVGIGPNKMIAKIASDLDKPDGFCHVTPERVREVLDPLPARVISGVGPKTVEALEAQGIHTIADLRTAREGALVPVFGRYARRMQSRASGIDDRPVVANASDKSISTEETFDRDIGDPARLRTLTAQMADKVAARLRDKRLDAGVVTVKLRTGDFVTRTRQRAFSPATSETRLIARIARELLDEWLAEHHGVRLRLLGVGVSALARRRQMGLFDAVAPKDEALDEAIDDIRARFGSDSLRRGLDD